MSSVSYETLQLLLQERQQRGDILREEMLETASKNRHDLEELCKNRDTLRAVHQKPWLAALVQTAPVPVEKESWDAYVKKHVLPWDKVTLPPDEEVDLDLLTHKILHPEPLLPPPREKCSIGFYPSFAKVKVKGQRPRALVWGALIPNTVLIRLLWSTQTLTRETSERWHRNRRLRLWEIMEKGLEGGSDTSLEEDLDSGSQYSHRNKFRRGAFGDISEHNLVSVVHESEMAIKWDQVQPLSHRRRRRGKSHRASRRKSHGSPHRRSSQETIPEEDSQKPRASSQPTITVTGDGAAEAASHASKRSSSAGSKGRKSGGRRRKRRGGGSSGKSRSSGQSGATGSRTSGRSSRPREDSELSDKPVFQRVVGTMKDKMHVSMFMGEKYDEKARKQAEFMRHLQSKSWLMNMLPGVDVSQIAPEELIDLMMDCMPEDNHVLVSKTVTELRTVVTQFPCQQPVAMKEKTLALLDKNFLQSGAFESILKLLQTLQASPDELIPLLLPLYPVCPEPTRRAIHTYLNSVGLRDPEKRLRHELLSWIVGSGTRARRNTTNQLALERKATHFLKEWRANLETNARLMEEDLLKKKMEAQVTLNIVKALAKYESTVLKLDDEELYLDLAGPPAVGFANSFTCVDVLNYFVEMSAPIPEEDTFSMGDKPLDTKEYRTWKRCNKQLVVAPMANRSLRGDAPLSSGVQLPTSLVTHDPAGGLAPVPWPRLTVQVQLRLAGKYLFHQQDTERQDAATIGAVLSASPSPSPSPDRSSIHK